ncbi:MAG: aminopeptidase P family protein [Abditibacteriota bacterium]|nr:aminopeptidase P family protein [Abditibacteriota bacterium]
MNRRIEKLLATSPEYMVISDLDNMYYFSGFTGDNGVLVLGKDRQVLITDSRYTLQSAKECPGFEIIDCQREPVLKLAGDICGGAPCGFEADSVSLKEYRSLCKYVKDPVETHGLAEALRLVKDPGEIKALEAACGLADRAALWLREAVKPGISETDLAVELEYFMKKGGASGPAFPSIIAAGENAACPHHAPEDRVIKEGDMVKCDFGCCLSRYNSDITRTFFMGEPSAEFDRIYGIVLEAQQRTIEAIKPGVPGKDIDAVAREFIAGAGYGDCFGHGLGHGLGLSVHDSAAFSPSSPVILEPGMVATVEPGIYIPGWGGVRIEDDVLVTEDGCRVLTHADK